MANECIPLYEPAFDVPANAAGAITGKRLVRLTTGGLQSGPGLSGTTEGGNMQVVQITVSGDKVFGVADRDAALNEKLTVLRGKKILPVEAGATIAAGDRVQADATGRAILLAAGVAFGQAVTAATVGTDCFVALD